MFLQAVTAYLCPKGAAWALGRSWPRPLLVPPRPLLVPPRLFSGGPRPPPRRAPPQRARLLHQKPRHEADRTWRGQNVESAHAGRSVQLNVQRDVVIFERSDRRLPLLLALFACGQAVFWIYLAHFSFGALTRSSELWRYGFSVFCVTVCVLIVLGSLLFSSRYVQRVVLLRGGRTLVFRTAAPLLGPFGPARTFQVAVDSVSCPMAISSATALLPVRVRGHRFYYLFDKQSTIPNRPLFDATLGTFRPF